MQVVDVSVIIPTYNRLAMLEEALVSVFSQDFSGSIRVIVVDDNSQDGTSELIKQKYPNVHLISLKQNVGAYRARNQAILESASQYIAFLDSDDFWESNYLSSQIDALQDQPRGFAASAVIDWRILDNQKRILLPEPDLEKYSSSMHHLLAEGSFICTLSAVVFPRLLFDEIGLFDQTYRISGDNDLYIRCLLGGYRLISVAQPTVIRRIHDQGQATNWSNLKVRKQCRLRQINKYHALAKQCFEIPAVDLIRAQVHSLYASRYYLRQRNFSAWLGSSLRSVYNAPGYGLSSMHRDVKMYIHHYVLRDLPTRMRKKFFGLLGIVRNPSRT